MFDRNPNLYADTSARFSEIAPVPRYASQFLKKYAHRVVYGTDMTYNQRMFSNTFRILESLDEHFYENYQYHWPLHGLGLPDDVLRKVYRETALNAFKQAQNNART
jgi:predicted TIM-barrel fold metal-dependent hydrolase